MTYQAVTTIVNLLSTIRIEPEHQELILLDELNSAFNFDHNILLLHSSVDINRFVNETKLLDSTPHSLHIFKNFDDLNDEKNLDNFRYVRGKNELLIVVPEYSSFDGTLRLLTFVKKIQLLNVNVKIGIFFSQIVSNDDLRNLFKWSWNNRIIKIFAAFYPNAQTTQGSLNVFSFDPFGKFDLLNLTNTKNVLDIFPAKKVNFHQHQFRLALIDDEAIIKFSTRIPFFGGPDGNMWNVICTVLNTSYSIFPVRKVMQPVEILDDGKVDVSVDLTELTGKRIVTVYPLTVEILLVVVPKALPYTAAEAFIKNLTSDNLSIYVFVTIAVSILVLTIARYVKKLKILFVECAFDVINLLVNYNNGIKYPLLTHSEIWLIVPLTFVGFIIVNGLLSNLKSHLTRPIMQHQVDTAEDLYNSSLPYISYNEFWMEKETKLLDNLLKRGDWDSRMSLANSSTSLRLVNQETSLAFSEYQFMAKILTKHKKYHVSQIQLQWIWFSYNARYDFPFTDRINEIIQWVQTAGIYDQWRKYAIAILEEAYVNSTTETAIEVLPVPIFVFYGYIAGVIVLFMEIIFKKYKFKEILETKLKIKF